MDKDSRELFTIKSIQCISRYHQCVCHTDTTCRKVDHNCTCHNNGKTKCLSVIHDCYCRVNGSSNCKFTKTPFSTIDHECVCNMKMHSKDSHEAHIVESKDCMSSYHHCICSSSSDCRAIRHTCVCITHGTTKCKLLATQSMVSRHVCTCSIDQHSCLFYGMRDSYGKHY